ncbi:putative protein OS=Streptomyces microflavus OX=1919 GN=Smic_83340 PE=4 SV=1 [Streptomyces microflavus]
MQASMTRTRPMNGRGYGGMEDDDNRRGPERDETDTDLFRQLVGHLVADGDGRAAAAGRQARRTFAEMVPGTTRQPVLLHRPRPLTVDPDRTARALWRAGRARAARAAGGRTVDTQQ